MTETNQFHMVMIAMDLDYEGRANSVSVQKKIMIYLIMGGYQAADGSWVGRWDSDTYVARKIGVTARRVTRAREKMQEQEYLALESAGRFSNAQRAALPSWLKEKALKRKHRRAYA